MRRDPQPDGCATIDAVRSGSRTATQVVTAALDAITLRNPELNAICEVLDDSALAEAEQLDGRVRQGDPVGPLAGLPVTVKDHIWLAGRRSANGSRALADFVPDRSAVCVRRLVDAGAIVVGRTTNPEFCYRGYSESEIF